jgi:hypothetical protein
LGTLTADSWKRLRRLAGWCSSRDIAPSDVSPKTFLDFYEFLRTQSVQRNVRERWQEARRAWNKAVALPGTAFPHIPDNAPARWRSRPWTEFPPSLQVQLDAWREHLGVVKIYEERKPLRPASIRNYDLDFRRHASRLVDNGAVAIESLTSMADLLHPELVKRSLDLLQGARPLEEARKGLNAMVHALLSALNFVETQPGDRPQEELQETLAILKQVANKVRDRMPTMTAKNRERLAQLSDERAAFMFRNLHLTVAARYSDIKQPTIAQALEMQSAAIHAFLLFLPVRISNLAKLDLERHITRPPGGNPGPWRIAFSGAEMKNGYEYESVLCQDGSDFVADYMARFRPVLTKGQSSAVFISSRTGQAKNETTLSKQYSGFVYRELGLRVHPHLLRHHAGMMWLNALPGEYSAVAKLLGHRSEKTAMGFYTGAEAKSAQDRYQSILTSKIDEDRKREARTGNRQ